MKQDMLQGRRNNPICFEEVLRKGWVMGQEGGCSVSKGTVKVQKALKTKQKTLNYKKNF